jgi:two-component system OmpR family sensor kinase
MPANPKILLVDDDIRPIFEVADAGSGIPEDELPFVWDKHHRGKGARGISGSGLGPVLVRAIAERH